MSRVTRLMGLGILGLALVVSVGISGDAKKDKDKEPTKVRHTLPTGWGVLKLSADQKKKVYAVKDDYAPKISMLEKKIGELKAQELIEMAKVLTDDQKAILTKALIGEEKDKAPPKDKDVVKDKKPDPKTDK